MSKDVAEEYRSSLADLTVNSKPLINMLTMLAEDYVEHAPIIVKAVEAHLQKVRGEVKLPVLYLIDSIVKNVGKDYVSLFTQNIVSNFCAVFEKVDEKVRAQMFKLRQTWIDIFPSKKLFALDARVNAIDPAWPITAPQPKGPRIHVNPKFLTPNPNPPTLPQTASDVQGVSILTEGPIQEELLTKKKELLELQKRKVELELLQTKAILEEQQRKLESQTAALKSEASHSSSCKKIGNFVSESKNLISSNEPIIKSNTSCPPELVSTSSLPQSQNFLIKERNILRRDPRRRLRTVNDVKNSVSNSNSGETTTSKEKKSEISSFVDENKDNNGKQKVVGSHSSISSSSKRKLDRQAKKHNRDLKSHHAKKMFYQKTATGDKCLDHLSREISGSESSSLTSLESSSTLKNIVKDTCVEKSDKSTEKSVEKHEEVKKRTDKIDKSRGRSKFNDRHKRKAYKSDIGSDSRKNEKASDSNSSLSTASPRKVEKIDKKSDPPQVIKMDVDNRSMEEIKVPHVMDIEATPPEPSHLSPPELKQDSIVEENLTSNVDQINNSNNVPPTKSESDVDLRLLLSPKSETEPPPEKKTKAEMIDKLFGEADVDLRTFPPPKPPTPPPPVISNPIDLTNDDNIGHRGERCWANIKRSNPEFAEQQSSSKKKKSINSPFKPSVFNQKEDIDEELSSSSSRDDSHSDFILKQAEEELKHGNITFYQYNQMLKDVMNLKEKKRIMESMEALDSPVSLSGSTSSSDSTSGDNQYGEADEIEKSSPRKRENDVQSSDETQCTASDVSFSESENVPNKRTYFNKGQDQQSSRKEVRTRYHGAYPEFAGSKPWMTRPPPPIQQSHHSKAPSSRETFYSQQRWLGKSHLNNRHFDPKKTGFISRYGPQARLRNLRHPQDLPPADPAVLEMIKNDPMALVNVGGAVREVRFYGETAVIMMAWDDPRELTFQSGCCRVIFDDVDVLSLQFNSPYRDYTLNDGIRIRIRLGAPTRELFIDGRFYDIKFGGAPIEANLKGRIHRIQLEGPIPFLKMGHVKRTDLVVGKVNLIVDANVKEMYPIYLDAKPQQFTIGGVPFILRFVEALQTVVINGRPFKVDFGGMPFPIHFHGEKHFLRMTHLPEGIVPGYVNILNMEGGRIPSPPPSNILPPPAPLPPPPAPFTSQSLPIESAPLPQPPYFTGPEKRFDLLSSLLPSQKIPAFPIQAYNVEQYQETTTSMETNTSSTTTISNPTDTNVSNSTMNLSELIQKLVESGIVPAVSKEKEDQAQEDKFSVKVVDFNKSETLKVRQPGLINKLYSGLQCGTCGVRFPPELSVKYSQHLDWHFRQNRKERDSSKIALSRRWNFDISDWIQYQEIEDIEDRAESWFEIQEKKNSMKEEDEEDTQESTVPAKGFGEHPCCSVCQDRFDQFFNEEKEEWQLKRAICIEEKLYHPVCYKDFKENPTHLIPMLPLPIQDEQPDIVETIILDDSTPGVSSEDEKMKGFEYGEVTSTSTTDEVTSTENILKEETSHEMYDENEVIVDKDDEANTSMDDDLVVVGVVQPVIEQYEILDDEDEEAIDLEENREEEKEIGSKDKDCEEVIFEEEPISVTIKRENDVTPPHIGPQANHPTETVTLDGNTEFTAPTTVVLPKKIKITISSILPKSPLETDEATSTAPDSSSDDLSSKTQTENTVSSQQDIETDVVAEELCPVQIKPKIVNSKLKNMPPISQGKEMSGLCSIM